VAFLVSKVIWPVRDSSTDDGLNRYVADTKPVGLCPLACWKKDLPKTMGYFLLFAGDVVAMFVRADMVN